MRRHPDLTRERRLHAQHAFPDQHPPIGRDGGRGEDHDSGGFDSERSQLGERQGCGFSGSGSSSGANKEMSELGP